MAQAQNWRDAQLTVREAEDADMNTQATHYATAYAAVYRDDDGNVQSAVTDESLADDVAALAKRLAGGEPSKAYLQAQLKDRGLPVSGTVAELQERLTEAEVAEATKDQPAP